MTPDDGLSGTEAAARLVADGPNELRAERGPGALGMLARQLTGVMPLLLVAAAVTSFLLGDLADAIAIAAILVINALIGFVQEHRAERAITALRAMTAPRATVVRDGHAAQIAAAEVVRGDLLVVEAGDVVAADAELVEANELVVDEATLTGESVAVAKRFGPSPPDTPLAERTGELFQGTTVAGGSGRARVTATGMATELGHIAGLLASTEREETPLARRLAEVGRWLVAGCVAIVVLVAAIGLLQGRATSEVVLAAVALAVAAIPEGLTAIVTIALAIGVQRMAARHVLVRRLPSVETLGCTTVICTDKTGTLTTGVMTVREAWGDDQAALFHAAAACCDAELGATPGTGTGDPTELAILAAARLRGIERAAIEAATPRRTVHPFDSERKRMSIARADGVLYVKGAVDALAPLCRDGAAAALAANAEMASRGLRVLAVAVGATDEERDLRLLGLIGLADPPRSEAIAAIAAARAAGIRSVMITGDHPTTARAIAAELGMLGPDDDPAEIVHARATPEDKLRIVTTWKARGEIVAMTGDGVNDAPALKEAHIGIAMGRTGTEVTREAASMVLADDNYASIVAAVREGRAIYDNIRKSLVYLLGGNAAEILVMVAAIVAGLPVPLLPLHLLWINLVTDGLPALALVMDPASADTLARPPRRPDEPLLGRAQWRTIALVGVLEASVALAAYVITLRTSDVDHARAMAFSVLVLSELLRAFAARSDTRVLWEIGAFSNLVLLGVVALSIVLQLAILSLPLTQSLFHFGAISGGEIAVAFAIALIPVSVLELRKLARRML